MKYYIVDCGEAMSKDNKYIQEDDIINWKAIHDAYFEEIGILAIEEMQRIINEHK